MSSPPAEPAAKPEKSESRAPDGAAEEVAPGILRVMLPVGLPGLGHVNCYVLEDAHGLALIDPGLADGGSHTALADQLREVGLDIADVHTVVVTHSHFDHYGGLARLRNLEGGRDIAVVTHRNFGDGWREAYDEVLESPEVDDRARADLEIWIDEVLPKLRRPVPWGGLTDGPPPEFIRFAAVGIDPTSTLRPPDPTHEVADGDRLLLGGLEWTVIHTPGHADDHICLWNGELGVMFSGDHVLPTITPHIGGLTADADPLGSFFDSLDRMESYESTIVLPAHGDPFEDLAGRARDIAAHHRDRLDRVRSIGEEIGSQPVTSYMQGLFRERSWGQMAASETYAHLEWLRLRGDATRSESGGTFHYDV